MSLQTLTNLERTRGRVHGRQELHIHDLWEMRNAKICVQKMKGTIGNAEV